MDRITSKQRSKLMSKIRDRDTKIEVMVRSRLFKKGYRFRKNDRRYPGKPDIVLPKYRFVVFVHGCFWHGHKVCGIYKPPKSKKNYWTKKILRNRKNDIKNRRRLKRMEWNVAVLRECQIKKNLEREIYNLTKRLKNQAIKTIDR